MLLFYLFALLLCVYESQQMQIYNPQRYKSRYNSEHSHRRLVELMRSYYEEAHSRLTYMNPIRFMYEESPYYEMGYITGEIIERYRKVLEHAQRPERFLSMTLFDILKRVELVQKLYFELYHLVRMIHETPRKWVTEFEFMNIENIAGPEVLAGLVRGKKKDNETELSLAQLFASQKAVQEMEKRRARERRRLRKEYKKLRQMYMEAVQRKDPNAAMGKLAKKYNTKWPLDYGWEIDYEW